MGSKGQGQNWYFAQNMALNQVFCLTIEHKPVLIHTQEGISVIWHINYEHYWYEDQKNVDRSKVQGYRIIKYTKCHPEKYVPSFKKTI